MSQKRGRSYPAEYRARLVELARSGRSPEELAEEFDPCAATIQRWFVQAEVDAGSRDGITSDERAELARLRREVKRLKIEREILGKAAAWFARESDTIPERGSRS